MDRRSLYAAADNTILILVEDRVVGNTPLRIEVDPKKVEAITLRQEGCDDITVPLTRSTGAGWIVLDILFLAGC